MRIPTRAWLLAFLLACFPMLASAQTADMLDLSKAQIVNAPDVRDWPVTTQLTSVAFDGSRTAVYFTKMDGAGRWPDVRPADWDGDIQYTLWLFRYLNDRWVGSAFIEFWHGREWTGYFNDPDVPSVYHKNWYYGDRWAPLSGSGPILPLEKIGFMVTSGDARDSKGPYWTKEHPTKGERSNIVVFQAVDKGSISFPQGDVQPVPDPVPMPTPVPAPVFDPAPLLKSLSDLQAVNDAQNTRLDALNSIIQALTLDLANLRASVKAIDCTAKIFGIAVACDIQYAPISAMFGAISTDPREK